ncbi:hypothetical protein BKA83DRAFT_4494404 [Pisolithus microcarpus]|nr:hypothetical protein BKA83DRAFT_4494404 [Pisolithus microcarpus]
MDSGKLPNYRSSYMFRFHPYARVKPSARERVMAALYTDDDDLLSDEQCYISSHATVVPEFKSSSVIAQNLDDVVNVMHSVNASRSRLSMSAMVVDLALLMCRKPPPTA